MTALACATAMLLGASASLASSSSLIWRWILFFSFSMKKKLKKRLDVERLSKGWDFLMEISNSFWLSNSFIFSYYYRFLKLRRIYPLLGSNIIKGISLEDLFVGLISHPLYIYKPPLVVSVEAKIRVEKGRWKRARFLWWVAQATLEGGWWRQA